MTAGPTPADLDPRTPVVVGVGQHVHRDRSAPTSPLELMAASARAALADAGLPAAAVESVGVTDCFCWNVPDPGTLLAAELGAAPRETVKTRTSGTSPLDLLADACTRIAAGDLDVVLLAGAESVKALQDGRFAGGPEQGADAAPTRLLGIDRDPTHPAEEAAGLLQPIHFYALFENALRAAAGEDAAEHDKRVAELWAAFAQVSARNPYAWDASAPDAATIAEAGPRNRMVAAPYRKLMTANISVDMGAALVVTSVAAATAAGIPRERWVFVNGTAGAHDHWLVGERHELHRSPAIAAIGRALLAHGGVTVADLDVVDLYSCFPSAVQIGAAELGVELDLTDPPTVTGGLTFGGGPGSNYVMGALGRLAERLRERPGSVGLQTALGWYMTKHAAALLSSGAPIAPYAHADVQAEVDAGPRREIAADATGTAPVEAFTVVYDRGGEPMTAIVSCLLGDGRRAFAASDDPGAVTVAAAGDLLGREVVLAGSRFELRS